MKAIEKKIKRHIPEEGRKDCVEWTEGITIEQKIARMMEGNEPITEDTVPLIYTERKDGIMPEYDIRADKWEIAIDAMNAVANDHLTKRQARIEKNEPKEGGKPKEE